MYTGVIPIWLYARLTAPVLYKVDLYQMAVVYSVILYNVSVA